MSPSETFYGQLEKGASLVAQMVKTACNAGDLGLIPELGRSLGENTHSSIPAGLAPWTERSLEDCNPWGRRELDTTEQMSPHREGKSYQSNKCREWLTVALLY